MSYYQGQTNYGAPPPQHPSQQYGHQSRPSQSRQSQHAPQHAPQHQSSYSAGPPGADPQLWQFFSNVDKDRSGSISLHELHDALKNGNWTSFDLDTIKMLMNIFDTDRSGTISFKEFVGLWKYIADWQKVFVHFDADNSGSIEGRELSEAMNGFGYNLSPELLRLLEQKYSSGPVDHHHAPAGITFDRLIPIEMAGLSYHTSSL